MYDIKQDRNLLNQFSCMSVAEIKLKLANLSVETKLRNTDKLADLLSRTQQ
jgi:hypothetical protein